MNRAQRRKPSATSAPGFDKGGLFRLSRLLHAYLSAFAFVALAFFSVSGILLNHPEWFENDRPVEQAVAFSFTPADLASARASQNLGARLAAMAKGKASLVGGYQSMYLDGPRALIRLEGPKGTSDLTVDLGTGAVQGMVSRANLTTVIQDLHRGKNSGPAWRFVIDATACLVLALSVIGYVLFFSLRFRLRTSLILTGFSFLALVTVAWWFVS